jgi:hypothetical protein
VASVPRSYKGTKKIAWRVQNSIRNRTGLSSWDGSRRWLRRNGKKGIRLGQEDFKCWRKSEWDCYKSVAMIRLVKAENSSACVTVNWKVRRLAIAFSPELYVKGVNKSGHEIQTPSYKSRATSYTWQYDNSVSTIVPLHPTCNAIKWKIMCVNIHAFELSYPPW